ncbi:MAG: MarR family transcriptional regulator [Rhizobiaceae bacterium]|nr:MarR family transcriptional regulator [Rhizobiaceae bacterium]
MRQSGHPKDISYLIASAHRRLYAGLEHTLHENELSVEQWRVLEALRERNGCSMGELAELVLMNHPALTKLADRMVANGLIHRVADMSDQRRVLVHATERGTAFFLRTEQKVAAHNKQIENAFGASKTAALRALLQDFVSENLTASS